MKYICLWILAASLFVASESYANMRRCLLLPIQDSVGGAIGFKVFEDIEKYIKDANWCYYQSNSSILDILSDHKRNLDSYLDNDNVLRIIAEKTKSGSIIRIKLKHLAKGIEVFFKVYGKNGQDVYFSEKAVLDKDDVDIIVQTIKNRLDAYKDTIPYDGLIKGVLGNQFTVDVGKSFGIFNDSEVSIKRVTGRKVHPLLKEIVDWDTDEIAVGKIFHAGMNQSQGQVSRYSSSKKLKVGDWVNLKNRKGGVVESQRYNESNRYSFGKLGEFGLFMSIGDGKATIHRTANRTSLSGGVFGVDLMTEIWMTRKYWTGLDVSRQYGTLKGDATNSAEISKVRAKFGYKYLPMGFFHGPQVDAFLGYARNKFSMETNASAGLTDFTFKGFLDGPLKVQFPYKGCFRLL